MLTYVQTSCDNYPRTSWFIWFCCNGWWHFKLLRKAGNHDENSAQKL